MYINTDTNQYPVSESEIRAAHPNTSFPQPFTPPDGYAWVFPAPPPAFDAVIRIVREVAPELTSKGTWEQRWEVVPRFAEYTDDQGVTHTVAQQEAAAIAADQAARSSERAASVRQQRDARLAASDWTQLPDAPVNQAAWAQYRHDLRGLPAQAGFPFNVRWPTEPAV